MLVSVAPGNLPARSFPPWALTLISLRVAHRLLRIGIGPTHAGTHDLLLVRDLHVRVINAAGDLLRELTINLDASYQPEDPR